MKKSVFRRTAAAVAATTMAVGATIFGISSATAAPGDYVAFGDSFPANPGPTDAVNDLERIGRGGCPQSGQNVGNHIAGQLGLNLKDYSCNGMVSYMPNTPERTFLTQVDHAINQGDLQNAEFVTFFLGANDAMQSFWAPNEIQDRLFIDNAKIAVDKVRSVAPNARILFVGYPEFISADPSHVACPINVSGFAPRIGAAPVKVYEDNLESRQYRASLETGTEFLHMKELANVNVGMCGDEGRLVSAFIDDNAGEYNMPNHLTHTGSKFFADHVVATYHTRW